MKNYRLFSIVAMIALMMCSVVQAQDDAPARGGQGGPGRGGQQADPAAQAQMVRFALLGMSEVQSALDLDEEAVEKLSAELKVAMPARGGRGGAGGGRGQGGRPEAGAGGTEGTQAVDDTDAKSMREAAAETVNKMLSEAQHARLTGIVAQALQGRALQDKDIAAKLEITEEQAADIKKVFEESQQEMRAAMQELMADGGQPDRDAMREAMTDIFKEASTSAMAVLTDDQKTALETLKGEAVELPEAASRLMMGGGRGGFGGGRGGPGGPGGDGRPAGGGGRPGGDGGNEGGF